MTDLVGAIAAIRELKDYVTLNMHCFSKKDYCACISNLSAVDFLISSNINESDTFQMIKGL